VNPHKKKVEAARAYALIEGSVIGQLNWLSKARNYRGNVSNWLVVSTPLKNISQWEGLSHDGK